MTITSRAKRAATSTRASDGFRGSHFKLGDDEFVVFSFDLPAVSMPAQLTSAERAITTALLNGLRTAQIASKRGTAVRTVETQVAAIFRKLSVTSRAELVALLLKPKAPRVP